MKQCKTCIHKEVCPKANHIENYRIDDCESYAGWISVSERLPRQSEYVLVYRPTMAVKILADVYDEYYGEDDGEWYADWVHHGKNSKGEDVITHWMPMPSAPESR